MGKNYIRFKFFKFLEYFITKIFFISLLLELLKDGSFETTLKADSLASRMISHLNYIGNFILKKT